MIYCNETLSTTPLLDFPNLRCTFFSLPSWHLLLSYQQTPLLRPSFVLNVILVLVKSLSHSVITSTGKWTYWDAIAKAHYVFWGNDDAPCGLGQLASSSDDTNNDDDLLWCDLFLLYKKRKMFLAIVHQICKIPVLRQHIWTA